MFRYACRFVYYYENNVYYYEIRQFSRIRNRIQLVILQVNLDAANENIAVLGELRYVDYRLIKMRKVNFTSII